MKYLSNFDVNLRLLQTSKRIFGARDAKFSAQTEDGTTVAEHTTVNYATANQKVNYLSEEPSLRREL